MGNPFTPTFGIVPPFLAGRASLLDEMKKAFERGLGDPNLCSILIGPRGSGKTAFLARLGEEVSSQGWIVADTVASEGMLEDILQRAISVSAERVKLKSRKKLTGISLGQFLGLEWTTERAMSENWRTRMTTLLTALKKHDIGLLITVDEVRADVDEMIQLASVYQLLIRDGYSVALVMAGLPAPVYELIDHPRVSFLRRARQHVLVRISDTEIRRAFRKTVESGGKKIKEDALEQAVIASNGYPYMMQLVGYSVWEESETQNPIQSDTVEVGIAAAREEFRNGVLRSTLRELSRIDKEFLKAMLLDGESSRVTDIAQRMNKSSGYVSTYKTRLLRAGVIEEVSAGAVTFSIPELREYLAET